MAETATAPIARGTILRLAASYSVPLLLRGRYAVLRHMKDDHMCRLVVYTWDDVRVETEMDRAFCFQVDPDEVARFEYVHAHVDDIPELANLALTLRQARRRLSDALDEAFKTERAIAFWTYNSLEDIVVRAILMGSDVMPEQRSHLPPLWQAFVSAAEQMHKAAWQHVKN